MERLSFFTEILDFLEDPNRSEVRLTAAHLLRTWLGRGNSNPSELIKRFQEHRGYTKEKAALIVQLLYPYAINSRYKPETLRSLVGYLDHENLAIRDLAWCNLTVLYSDWVTKMPFDPAGTAESRRKGSEAWKSFLARADQAPTSKDK